MYMQLLQKTHIYIHVTHTILQCMCAGVGYAQTCNQLWAGSAVVCPMCVNKINVSMLSAPNSGCPHSEYSS